MEEKNLKSKETNRSYEPPKATFVPLKVEERLLGCGKVASGGSNQCAGAGQSDGLTS